MHIAIANNQYIIEKDLPEKSEAIVMKSSTSFNSKRSKTLPNYTSVETGILLGRGEFGTVREVMELPEECSNGETNHSFSLRITSICESTDDETDEDSISSELLGEDDTFAAARRMNLGKRCWRNGKARYAVKSLRQDLRDTEHGDVGLLDLAMEAKLLASLSHPNIIKLRGTVGVSGHYNFMLILDRLYSTLSDRLSLWKTEKRRIRTNCAFGLRKKSFQNQCRDLMMERLVTAYDIARVFKYLHENNIIYRDMKPDNIGYDIRGDLRIFDFGLARELTKEDLVGLPESYNCTGLTGSPRWMAPEVHLCQPYGPSADVYSFGLVFWNIFSLKTPFGQTTRDQLFQDVVQNNKRPSKIKSLSQSLHVMMTHCWSSNPAERPSFRAICSILKSELKEIQDQQLDGLNETLLDRTMHLECKSLCSVDHC